MSVSTKTEYIPGTCNINYTEIAQRRKLGHFGAASFVIGFICLLVLGVDAYYRILLFLPALLAASGYLQARNHFCVSYAMSGKQNAAKGSTSAVDIIEKEARAADKRRAARMNAQSFGIAVILTVVVILV